MNILEKLKRNHHPHSGALELLKYIGPGLLVTVGFIDPGNWATNLAAGSEFGYALLWVVTFSSIMLIIIQHNVAHLGIVTGLCLSEATTQYLPKKLSLPILISAMMASISTSLAEILGGAIALKMLFSIPIKAGAVIVTLACLIMLLSNTYSKIERWIIMFVSIIGLSFLYELALVDVNWQEAAVGWIKPSFPDHSLLIVMSVLGAVVMPHNLFLHSEVIQSRKWNLEDKTVIHKQLTMLIHFISINFGGFDLLSGENSCQRTGPGTTTLIPARWEQCRRHLCCRFINGGYFIYDNFGYCRSFHLRRYLRRSLSSQRYTLENRCALFFPSGSPFDLCCR